MYFCNLRHFSFFRHIWNVYIGKFCRTKYFDLGRDLSVFLVLLISEEIIIHIYLLNTIHRLRTQPLIFIGIHVFNSPHRRNWQQSENFPQLYTILPYLLGILIIVHFNWFRWKICERFDETQKMFYAWYLTIWFQLRRESKHLSNLSQHFLRARQVDLIYVQALCLTAYIHRHRRIYSHSKKIFNLNC